MSHARHRSKRAPGSPAPTIKQVAERAGVSIATVSRVLTGSDGVSDELKARVREAAQTLDYHPNRNARHLRVRVARTVGLVISDIQNPFFTSVVRGIEDMLQRADYTLLFGNTDENHEREQLYLATLRAEGVAGIIFAPSSDEVEEYAPLVDAHVPLVAIDRVPAGLRVDSVQVANRHGAAAAVSHLIGLGHRRIGFIGGPRHLSTASERRAGYLEALEAVGISPAEALIEHGDFRQSGGYAAMQALLQRAEAPTAVFVVNNLMTLGALEAIHAHGLRIPDEIAVVGFDDMAWATSLQPPLTAVAQPTYEMGAAAARLLLARLAQPERPAEHLVLETRLMVRASCGAVVSARAGIAP